MKTKATKATKATKTSATAAPAEKLSKGAAVRYAGRNEKLRGKAGEVVGVLRMRPAKPRQRYGVFVKFAGGTTLLVSPASLKTKAA